jgi:hypothetical protein
MALACTLVRLHAATVVEHVDHTLIVSSLQLMRQTCRPLCSVARFMSIALSVLQMTCRDCRAFTRDSWVCRGQLAEAGSR